jgi:hypothetical protein
MRSPRAQSEARGRSRDAPVAEVFVIEILLCSFSQIAVEGVISVDPSRDIVALLPPLSHLSRKSPRVDELHLPLLAFSLRLVTPTLGGDPVL